VEVAVILAQANSSSSLSQTILKACVCPSDLTAASKLRISPEYLAAWLLAMSGLALRRSCYHALGRLFTYELSIRKDHHLVTTGPYAVVRHPSYTGVAMCVSGATISFILPGSWLGGCSDLLSGDKLCSTVTIAGVVGAPLILLLTGRIGKEDEILRQRFGEEWDAWRVRVPYKLIPGVY
jgi:protein-S-isoprenylcysteine O-methyltransferase Ste14